MSRQTSYTIISAVRATSVVDTPMRKVEVLEQADGRVVIRAIEFDRAQVQVSMVHLANHEAQALAKVIVNLEDQPV